MASALQILVYWIIIVKRRRPLLIKIIPMLHFNLLLFSELAKTHKCTGTDGIWFVFVYDKTFFESEIYSLPLLSVFYMAFQRLVNWTFFHCQWHPTSSVIPIQRGWSNCNSNKNNINNINLFLLLFWPLGWNFAVLWIVSIHDFEFPLTLVCSHRWMRDGPHLLAAPGEGLPLQSSGVGALFICKCFDVGSLKDKSFHPISVLHHWTCQRLMFLFCQRSHKSARAKLLWWFACSFFYGLELRLWAGA